MTEEAVVDAPVKNYAYMADDFDDFVPEPAKPEPAKPEPTPAPKPEPEPAKPEPTPAPKPEPEPAKPEPAAVATPEPKPTEVSKEDWRTAIKSGVDKYDVLKELGYDPWTIDMLKYKDVVGNIDKYAEVKSVDYKKMSPEQLIKLDMQKQNQGMSEKALNFKINKELSEKYYLNRDDYPEGSDEAEYGQEQMRLDGEQKRKAFIEEQDKFKAPEPQPDLDATKRDAELQQQRASIGKAVMNNDVTKNLQTAKNLVYGEGKESFNYPITDVQPLIDTVLSTVQNSGRTNLDGVDMNVFYKQLAYGRDPAAFEKAFAAHHRALGVKQVQDELHNITPKKDDGPAPDENLTGAQQLAKYGKIT